ncbi:hypothetical protein F5Y04DRAFT_275229 [Hypomontagnella monticulosa]|nr:hypothetical protein F5Y04DRAFT_275229 [Hypomontagnella monticulosa]
MSPYTSLCRLAKIEQVHKSKGGQQPINNALGTASFSNSLKDRVKHPKLRGADVYVARFGGKINSGGYQNSAKKSVVNAEKDMSSRDDSLYAVASSTASGSPIVSLHDELSCKRAKIAGPKTSTHKPLETVIDQGSVLDSRPCYRCVLYMHSAGIRRVYWTNSAGQWEGAKVRDLFDQVSGTNVCDGHDVNNGSLGGVFVTKHEILMLRRLAQHEYN